MKKIKRFLIAFIVSILPLQILAEELWVGQTYQCFIEDYANSYYDWINISWDVDYGLYSNFSGTYVRTVSFNEYKSGTYNVKANWTETKMSDPYDPFRHKSHTWYFTCKDNPLVLGESSMNLPIGQSQQLSCSFTYNNSYTKDITYSSSNTSVATVNSYGLVTAKGEGTTYITVSSASSRDEKECLVTVGPNVVKVTSIALNDKSAILKTGDTYQLTATVFPNNATDKTVSWKSSSTSVARVSSNGLVTAIAEGTAIITCTANDGSGVSASCNITVNPDIVKVSSITLNEKSAIMNVSETKQLTATVLPNNATDKTVNWKSSNISVATVSSNGFVTAIAEGAATITCTANDGSGVSASCTITVTEQTADVSFVSVICDNTDRDNLTQNDKLLFHATFENRGATDEIYSMVALIDTKLKTIIAHGDFDIRSFKGGEQTTIEYVYPLDTIAPGKYEATVLYYDFNFDDDGGSWVYGGDDYLWDITVKESPTHKGDVNGDNEVNGTDLVALANMILGRNAETANGDVNGDGYVNGTDYVVLTNIILKRSNARRKAAIQIPKELQNILYKNIINKKR